jgi:hypothetical protein
MLFGVRPFLSLSLSLFFPCRVQRTDCSDRRPSRGISPRTGHAKKSLTAATVFFAFSVPAFCAPTPNFTVTSFNTVAAHSTATPQVLNITVTIPSPGGTPTSVNVVTQGNANLDFTDAQTGTCSTSQSYNAGDTCTVGVKYQPLTPGGHRGAVVLSFGSTNAIAYVYGMSTGSLGVIVPGLINTIAGTSTQAFAGDLIPATTSPIKLPLGEAVDAAGNIYLSDSGNFRIQKIDPNGIIDTYVGDGEPGSSGDGSPARYGASVTSPASIVIDGAGNLYFTDNLANVIRMVDSTPNHIISTIVGTAGVAGGPPSNAAVPLAGALLNQPNGLALGPDLILYVADSGNNLIRAIDLKVAPAARTITTVAGTLTAGFAGDGEIASAAVFRQPGGIALDPNCVPNASCFLYVADVNNNVIRKLDVTGTGTTSTVAGVQTPVQSTFSGDGGPATSAQMQNPGAVVVDLAGNIYIADSEDNRIRKVDTTAKHIISTISGAGQGFQGDGTNSNQALLDAPSSLALDASGNLYIGDLFNNRVRMISSGVANLGDYGQVKNFQMLGPDPESFENDGNDVLSTLTFTFLNASLDPATSTCLSDPTLNVGVSCTLGVDFAPQIQDLPSSQAGTNEPGTVTISSNAANSSGLINMSGDVLTVNPTTAVVTSSAPTSALNAPVIFTATVSNNGNGPLTGTVNFFDNGVMIGAGTIPAGNMSGTATASFTTSSLTLGTHPITVIYAGDLNDAPSLKSPVFNQVIKNGTTLSLSSTPNPSTYPASVSFMATLTGATGALTNTVTFLDGGTALGGPVTPVAGVATFSTVALTPGTHVITAAFSGDTQDLDSTSNPLNQTVSPAPSTTALAANPNPPAGVVLGTTVNFMVTVASGNASLPVPGGSVELFDAGNLTPIGGGTLTNGMIAIPISALATGTHTITASYSGDTNDAASSSVKSPVTVVVNPIGTTTTLSSSAVNPASAGSTVILTANVTSPTGTTVGGALTGTVQFFDGTTLLGSTSLANGVAAQTVTAITVGTHSFTATYEKSTNYASSTSMPFVQTVDKATTMASLSSSPSSQTAGKTVTFTATVSGSGGIPAGQVNFTQNGALLGSGNLNPSGQAVFTTSSLPVGNDMIIAKYLGDMSDTGSESPSFTQVISIATTSLTLNASASPVVNESPLTILAGVPVTLSVTLTGQDPQSTGTITLKDGGTLLATITPSGSVPSTFTVPTLPVGPHTITASFAGDINDTSSTAVASVTVQQVPTTTTLTSNSNPGVFSQPITFTANVVSGAGSNLMPGGSVTFQDNGVALGAAVPLNGNGGASLSVSTLSLGNHSIVAMYSGDANHIAGQSTALKQQVLQAAAIAIASNNNPSTADTNTTFTATLSGTQGLTPTGAVTFKDGGNVLGVVNAANGLATFTTAALAVGSHPITASYGGDTNYQPIVSSALIQTVTIANTTVSLTSNANPATSGSPLTFSTTVTGTGGTVSGSVTFADGATVIGRSGLNASGTATFTTTALSPGQHVITAVYSGDSNNSSNTSAVLHQQVQQVTVTSLTSSANPALTLAPIVITCAVSNGGTQPATGTVTFTDGGSALGSVVLDGNGFATISLPSLPAGQHPIVVTYSGDVADFASASAPLAEVVQLRTTTDVLTATTDVATTTVTTSPTNGEELTLISVVRWTGPTTPTGSVVFKLGGTVVGTSLVDSVGVATLVVDLNPGSAQFMANYSGDSVYGASVSPATSITNGPPTSFTMQLSPSAVTLASKQNTTINLTLTSLSGFSDTLSLGCLGLPFAATCTFSTDQASLTANGTQVVHVVIDTGSPLTAGSVASNGSNGSSSGTAMLRFLPLGALLGIGLMRSRKRRPLASLLLLLCAVGLTLGLSGCGTLNINGTPAGTYTFKITASGVASGVTQSTPVTLTVQQ